MTTFLISWVVIGLIIDWFDTLHIEKGIRTGDYTMYPNSAVFVLVSSCVAGYFMFMYSLWVIYLEVFKNGKI